MIAGVTKNLTVDSSFSNSLLLSLAQDFRSANLSTIPSYTYPTENSVAVPGALDPETQQGAAVIQQWLDVGQAPPPPAKARGRPAPGPHHRQSGLGQDRGAQRQRCGRPGRLWPARSLSRLGYDTTVSGDAPNFGLATTEIEYAPRLPRRGQTTAGPAGRRGDADRGPGPAPTVVQPRGGHRPELQGRRRTRARPARSASTAATTAARHDHDRRQPRLCRTQTVNPDSSSVYDGVYIPPGLSPGQTPQTCGE